MTLAADISLSLGTLELRVALTVAPGEVVAILGPNGAGKTTLLRTLAGLQPIDNGRVEVDGVVLEDPSTGAFVPAEGRPVGIVFQDYLLFPHMHVLDNVAFGPRARGASKQAANDIARRWIDRVGLHEHTTAKPSDISGGESQRAALARALATEPRLLLLDEPLAALDVTTRATLRRDLRTHLADFDGAAVLVTHDPLDALALADRVVILEAGTVTQSGDIAAVSSQPRTAYVAELFGLNLLRGVADGNVVTIGDRATPVTVAGASAGPTLLLMRPSAIALHLHEPDSSARNRWRCEITGFDLLGDRVRVRLTGPLDLMADVTPAAIADLGLVEGSAIWASVKATDISTYPA